MPKESTLFILQVFTFLCVIYILQDDIALPVSIKVANENIQDRRRLLREAAVLGQFSHGNIVRLCGVVSDGDPVGNGMVTRSAFRHAYGVCIASEKPHTVLYTGGNTDTN